MALTKKILKLIWKNNFFHGPTQKVKTDEVEPLVSVSENKNILREDKAVKSIDKSDAFANAPKKDSDYFRIPKVLKK